VKALLVKKYQFINGYLGIIPNYKMISHANFSVNQYSKFVDLICSVARSYGVEVFLLNHEGEKDYELCLSINNQLQKKVPVLTNLNSREIKGIIKISKLIISSRYHGVASSLNQGIPCLATSWSHKYELLFKDYDLEDMLLSLDDDFEKIEATIANIFSNYSEIKSKIERNMLVLSSRNEDMWSYIWSFINEKK